MSAARPGHGLAVPVLTTEEQRKKNGARRRPFFTPPPAGHAAAVAVSAPGLPPALAPSARAPSPPAPRRRVGGGHGPALCFGFPRTYSASASPSCKKKKQTPKCSLTLSGFAGGQGAEEARAAACGSGNAARIRGGARPARRHRGGRRTYEACCLYSRVILYSRVVAPFVKRRRGSV